MGSAYIFDLSIIYHYILSLDGALQLNIKPKAHALTISQIQLQTQINEGSRQKYYEYKKKVSSCEITLKKYFWL